MSLFGLFERRTNLENPATPLDWNGLARLLGVEPGDAGETVTPRSALKMAAVWRATAVIAGLCGSLPLRAYEMGTRNATALSVLDDPHWEMTQLEWKRLTAVHRCLWGNFYAQKVRNGAGQVRYLHPIHPERVRPGLALERIPENPTAKIFEVTDDLGQVHAWTSREVLHIPGMGYDGVAGLSPVRHAAQGIGLALAAERHGAKFFGSGNRLSGILKTTQRLDQKQADALQARWRQKLSAPESSHDVAVVDSGAEFQSLTMPNDDAQLLESRHFEVSDVGRFFGVPAFLMGETDKSTSWGTGLEQQMTGFVVVDLGPMWLGPVEARLTKEILSSRLYAKYAVNGLLRGDSTARAEFYRTMRELGVFNADDIAELEDRPPLPDGKGQIYLQPMNFAPLGWTPPTNAATGGTS